MRARVLLVLLACIGCGHPSGHAFGALTDDGIEAFHSSCSGDFELTSKFITGITAVDEDPNSRFLTCSGVGQKGAFEDGTVAYDARTKLLLDANFVLHSASFDKLVPRLVVPALDASQREGLEKLHQLALARVGPPSKQGVFEYEWHDSEVWIALDLYPIVMDHGVGLTAEPNWHLILVPRLDK